MKKIKNITRLETARFQGWIVKIQYNGAKRFKQLSDRKYGSKETCLKEAKTLLEQFKQEIGYSDGSSRRIMKSNPHNLRGARRGVSRIWNPYGEYFLVTWQDSPGHTRKKVFSINKYGEDEAQSMAIAFREEREIEIYGMLLD